MANYKNKRRKELKEKRRIKRKYARRRFWALMIIFFIVWYFNNYTLKITSTSVTSPKISEPVRLAVLSDYHVHAGSISSSSIMAKLEKIDPDAVMILGDMYSRDGSENDRNRAIWLMSDIAAEYPAYFVSGDHDISSNYLTKLAENNVHVMNYAAENMILKGQEIRIMGIDNVYYTATFDLRKEFTIVPSCYNILLAHIPNYTKFSDFGADLTLCADTHGGMVRLPIIGTLFDPLTNRYLPTLRSGTVYDKGWFEYESGSMFITSGIGDSPYALRFWNRPEIVSIDILPLPTT